MKRQTGQIAPVVIVQIPQNNRFRAFLIASPSERKSATASPVTLADTLGVRLENGNYPTLSVLSLTGDFVSIEREHLTVRDVRNDLTVR